MADVNTTAEYIWRRAKELGVDPRAALGVAKFEGLNPNTLKSPTYGNPDAKGYSFGPFQLYSGSKDPTKIAPGGMAYEFLQKYGEAPSASNWQQQTDFALERMANKGFGAWYAVRDRGGLDKITAAGEKYASQLGLTDGASSSTTAAPASQASGPWGQFAQDVIGGATLGAYGTKYPGQGTSSTAIPSLLGQATGGLLGQATVPSAMGIDTRKFGEVTEPGFSGAALPAQQEVAAAATDMGFKDYAPSMGGAAGIGSALASLGGALAKAGAAKEDMSWVQKELPAHRGKWDDEIFKRSIFGIRGLLG